MLPPLDLPHSCHTKFCVHCAGQAQDLQLSLWNRYALIITSAPRRTNATTCIALSQ